MLLKNYTTLNDCPGRFFGGFTHHLKFNRVETQNNFYFGDATVSGETNKASVPNGYVPPYSWIPAIKDGGIASSGEINGSGSITGGISQGINIESDLDGSGSLAANLALVTSCIATLSGIGSLSGDAQASLNMAASLAGSGDLTGAVKIIANVVASLTGTGSIASDLKGKLWMDSIIYVNESEATVQQLVEGVWAALASDYNDTGTMGEKLNDAGSAGNPWAALLDDNNDPGSFGERVQKLLTVAKYLGLK